MTEPPMTRPTQPRTLPLLVLACALAACSSPESPEPAKPAAAKPAPAPAQQEDDGHRDPTNARTRLTIYSGDYDRAASAGEPPGRYTPGYALVDSTLRYTVASGANTITLTHLPRAIDSSSATLRGAGVRVDSQRFLAPPSGAEAV